MRNTLHRARLTALTASAGVVLLALAACSSGSGTGSSPASGGSSSSSSASTSSTGLKTASSSLGTIVVDGNGMTAYVFDQDKQNSGKSTCTGACAAQWPAIETSSDNPTVTGVTAKVGTIVGVDGKKQITLDGRPVYTFSEDTSAGQVTGQGFANIWWVVAPDGSKITTGANSSGTGGY